MLEREGYNVLDSFNRHCERISWETLADNNLDTPDLVCRAPVTLPEQLAPELGEFENLKVTVLSEL